MDKEGDRKVIFAAALGILLFCLIRGGIYFINEGQIALGIFISVCVICIIGYLISPIFKKEKNG